MGVEVSNPDTDYKVANDGYINVIDDAKYFKIGNDDSEVGDAWNEPVPSMTLHPRQVKKLLYNGDRGDPSFDFSMKIAGTTTPALDLSIFIASTLSRCSQNCGDKELIRIVPDSLERYHNGRYDDALNYTANALQEYCKNRPRTNDNHGLERYFDEHYDFMSMNERASLF